MVFIFVILLLPLGCQEISTKETVFKRGLLYKIGEREPFTGVVTGFSREGYRKRKMKFEKRYQDGIRQGDTRFWYPNGKLESVEPYTHGKINGVITRYHEDGKIKSRIHIVNNQRGGSRGEQFWDESQNKLGAFAKRFF
jgi:antitoxin component YwqK of YwqJK toxin-antitoxin module